MQHLLRAISGPQAGAVYVLGRRTTLGRASDCDIQVLHEGVSRQHAKVSQNADGQMVVTDLSSDNGTYVENQRITRQVLEPGDAIRIMSSRFVYEVLERGDQVTSEVFHRKVTSGDSLRQTANHRASMASARAMGRSQGRPAERGRPASRPQAAAPANPGARPGGLINQSVVRSDGIETRAVTREVPLAEQEPVYDARQAGREEETDSGEYVRRRWPGVPNQEQVPDHSLARQPTVDERADDWADESPSARTIGYGETQWRPFARGPQRERDNGYGWQAGEGGRRERVEISSRSLARATTPIGQFPGDKVNESTVSSGTPPSSSAAEPVPGRSAGDSMNFGRMRRPRTADAEDSGAYAIVRQGGREGESEDSGAYAIVRQGGREGGGEDSGAYALVRSGSVPSSEDSGAYALVRTGQARGPSPSPSPSASASASAEDSGVYGRPHSRSPEAAPPSAPEPEPEPELPPLPPPMQSLDSDDTFEDEEDEEAELEADDSNATTMVREAIDLSAEDDVDLHDTARRIETGPAAAAAPEQPAPAVIPAELAPTQSPLRTSASPDPAAFEPVPAIPDDPELRPSRIVTAARVRRGPGDSDEGSGAEAMPDRPAVASSRHGTGAGWSRVARPVETPGSMRPRATMSGMPRVEPEPAAPDLATRGPNRAEPVPVEHTGRWRVRPPGPSTPAPGAAPRKSSTAEYGMVTRGAPASPQSMRPSLPSEPNEPNEATPSPAAEATPAPTPAPEPDAPAPEPAAPDEPVRRPAVRRAAPGEGAPRRPWRRHPTSSGPIPAAKVAKPDTLAELDQSSAPEKIEKFEPPADDPTDVDANERTRPRIRRTKPPGDPTRPAEPFQREPDSPQTFFDDEHRKTPRFGVDRSIAYEETLRFRRDASPDEAPKKEATAAEPAAAPSVAPPEVTAEPEPEADIEAEPAAKSDVPVVGEDAEFRVDGRTHDVVGEASPSLDEVLEKTPTGEQREVGEPEEVADLSADDRAKLRNQALLERADRESRHKASIDTLVQILEYRELRLRSLRGDALSAESVSYYSELENKLQQQSLGDDDMAAMRRYHRFTCALPAQLRYGGSGASDFVAIEVSDISAGGARITCGEGSLGVGDLVSLVLDLSSADRSRIPDPEADALVLTARVVWARPLDAVVGLVFAGMPTYERGLVLDVDV